MKVVAHNRFAVIEGITDASLVEGTVEAVVEVGGEDVQPNNTYNMLSAVIQKVREVPNNNGLGVFYWEPQVYGEWKPSCYDDLGWPSYNMGGFSNDGKAGEIMTTLTSNK